MTQTSAVAAGISPARYPMIRSMILWIVVAVLATWLMVLLHEAGHFVPALFLFPELQPELASPWGRRIVYAGGPIVSQAMIVWAWWTATRSRADGRAPSPRRLMFAITFGLASASRAIMLANAARGGVWRGDEAALAREFGTSMWVFFGIEVPIAIAGCIWLIRATPRPRLAYTAAAVMGIFLGWVTTVIIGPRLGLPI